ncbi:MAG: DUF4465 domain-containing protein [Rikenellaceae bacterium]
MRRILLLNALFVLLSMVSCKRDGAESVEATGTEIIIGLSTYSVDYTPLTSRSLDSGDLAAIQIYDVTEDEVAYAKGLFSSLQDLTFVGQDGGSYRVVATVVKSAETMISSTVEGVYGKPFESAVTNQFEYSDVAFVQISNGGAKLAINDEEYSVPNIDRYYCDTQKSVSISDCVIPIYFKRVSFGVSNTIDGLDGEFTLSVAGAPALTIDNESDDYSIYTFSNIIAAYNYDTIGGSYSESYLVTINYGGKEVFSESVAMKRNQAAWLTVDIDNSVGGSFDVEFEDGFESGAIGDANDGLGDGSGDVSCITFEDKAGSSEWSSIVTISEYVVYTGELFVWSDSVTSLNGWTNLYGIYDGCNYYGLRGGGSALSNFYKSADNATSSNILSVPCGDEGSYNSGNNGSVNFLVMSDVTTDDPDDTALSTEIAFAEGVEATILSVYVANTSYVCNQWMSSATSSDELKVTATGYDKSGEKGASTTFMLSKDGELIYGWNRWELSSLGAVHSVTFTIRSSVDDIKRYVAIDDITVSM